MADQSTLMVFLPDSSRERWEISSRGLYRRDAPVSHSTNSVKALKTSTRDNAITGIKLQPRFAVCCCCMWYNNATTVLRPFVRDYPGEPVPEETLTHPPSWSSSGLYLLLPSTTIHSILPVQMTCLAIFWHNLFPCPFWSTSWSGALHLIFHTFLHPISVFFLAVVCDDRVKPCGAL